MTKPDILRDFEQSAFEQWLETTCPSGDAESIRHQWEESTDFRNLFKMGNRVDVNQHKKSALQFRRDFCLWDYDNGSDHYYTECDRKISGLKDENQLKYCPFCGGIITAM